MMSIAVLSRPFRLRSISGALAVCGLVFPVIPGPVHAASFDCSKAEAADETAICADLRLNDRDVEMATRFEILRSMLPMGGNAKLREDQEEWLKERRSCGRDRDCLLAAYDVRLKILRAVVAEFAKQGPQ